MNVLENGDSGNSKHISDNSKPPSEDEISDQLLHVPPGHHYLILYPDIETMRKVYASYIKKAIGKAAGFCFRSIPLLLRHNRPCKTRSKLEGCSCKRA